MAYDVVDFQKEVIDASFEQPVLVDFWAPWCGPCRVLGPVLEKLAGEESGRWRLAKINTDQNQEISMQYGIRGIPAVKLFVDGQVVNEFTGALPEHMVRAWLEEAIPSGEDLQLASAEAAVEAGQFQMAREILDALIWSGTSDPRVYVLMARTRALEEPREALGVLAPVELTEVDHIEFRDTLETIVRLLDVAEGAVELADGPGREAYLKAAQAAEDSNWDEALKLLIEVIQSDRYFDDDGARKACIAIFKMLGPSHEFTRKHRRMFDMVLY